MRNKWMEKEKVDWAMRKDYKIWLMNLRNSNDDINFRAQKRKEFSRRRTYMKEEDVYHINERNRIYNKKLQRNFGEYVKDIKSNMERGTAIWSFTKFCMFIN